MNIEELSKSQLLLLMILVNFVTSVATGIITVSLLDQAPPQVTQTVDRIVDHTVETVVQPAAVVKASAPTPAAPSEEDLATSAFASLSAHTVEIYDGKEGTSSPAIAVGTYLPQSEVVATAALGALPTQALIVFSNGSSAPGSLAKQGGGVAIYGFGNKAPLPSLGALTLEGMSSLKLGETVLALTLDGTAEEGIVSKTDKSISTTLSNAVGGPGALDLSGNFIGIASGASAGDFISADAITTLLTASSSPAGSSSAATSSAPHA